MRQTGYRNGYTRYVVERAAMAEEIVAAELLDSITADGLEALSQLRDGSATLQASSQSQIDQIAVMLKRPRPSTSKSPDPPLTSTPGDANQLTAGPIS